MASEKMSVDRREYALGGVKAAEVEVEMRIGSLAVRGGSAAFCEAEFEYSHPELRPVDQYEQDDDEASLEISQPRVEDLRDARSSWRLGFNSDVQIDLAVVSMSGNVSLDLDRVRLANFEVESKSGNVEASLAGEYPELDEMTIDSMSGPVRARLSGNFPELTEIEIDSKSGKVALAITGECPSLRRVAVDSKSGNVDLDLRGSFTRDDFGVRVDCVSGGVRIRVPEDVGISMNATTISGRVSAEGFSAGTGRLTNDAFGKSEATLWLNLHVVSGNIEVSSE